MGLWAIIPATVLLTISFFVLFVIRKIETQGLKIFGYVIAALLWVSALVIFSSGVYTMSKGRCMMYEMMKTKMPGMMMRESMAPMMQGKTAPTK
jgi:hypothetical protein